jgi:hypothetical protein
MARGAIGPAVLGAAAWPGASATPSKMVCCTVKQDMSFVRLLSIPIDRTDDPPKADGFLRDAQYLILDRDITNSRLTGTRSQSI